MGFLGNSNTRLRISETCVGGDGRILCLTVIVQKVRDSQRRVSSSFCMQLASFALLLAPRNWFACGDMNSHDWTRGGKFVQERGARFSGDRVRLQQVG